MTCSTHVVGRRGVLRWIADTMREGHTPSDQDAVWSKYGSDVVRELLPRQTIQKISN
jgi:hypothetical protein